MGDTGEAKPGATEFLARKACLLVAEGGAGDELRGLLPEGYFLDVKGGLDEAITTCWEQRFGLIFVNIGIADLDTAVLAAKLVRLQPDAAIVGFGGSDEKRQELAGRGYDLLVASLDKEAIDQLLGRYTSGDLVAAKPATPVALAETASDAAADEDAGSAGAAAAPAAGDHILLVDDQATVRGRLACALEARGIKVEEAGGSMEAIRALAKKLPASFVVSTNVDNQRGVAFVRGLTCVREAKGRPIVLLLENEKAQKALGDKPIAGNVTTLVAQASLPELVKTLLDRLGRAAVAPDAAAGGGAGDAAAAPSIVEEKQKEISDLDKVFAAYEDIVKRIKNNKLPGPMMPDLLTNVRRLTADKNIAVQNLSRFVEKHQALSARLLAVANSALYARGVPLRSTEQAIMRLGLGKVGPLLQAVAALAYVRGKDQAVRDLITASLKRSYFVGLVSEFLAQQTGSAEPQEVYTIGLFHNVGATFLLYSIALLQEEGELESLSAEALATAAKSGTRRLNHVICKAMNLPSEIELLHSYKPEDLEAERPNPILVLVHQAMWVAERVLDAGQKPLELDRQAEMLSMSSATLQALNAKLEALLSPLESYGSD
jgi:HD-like signal output (HDOD) protein